MEDGRNQEESHGSPEWTGRQETGHMNWAGVIGRAEGGSPAPRTVEQVGDLLGLRLFL